MFLGRVIEKVSGKDYFEYIKELIMDPIGVTNFILADDKREDKNPKEPTYYPLEFRASPYSIRVRRADSAFGLAISP